ncbi:dimethylallyltranstransferase, putative [Candida dubliniensis CD36]|uniref:Farnesyl pyrophosphate synthase n=1 Tax=Candida dubliniensis (strain CD36 / ATCC MYA-646 / CBS 7987 / NCPF 3949 / NRRL Y-17841) TaxID=573826 RepID=B9WBC8_CANDC|nr:dimethylallyltranstransferase, putative [Candida dubliniensis CD36]CAX43698.1 dimethylallyltranstransferase, putative [Candida dubliniensis CD36]
MSDKLVAKERFLNVFEDLIKELKQILLSYNMPQEAIDWFIKSLNYNTPGGKLNRGLSVVDTYAILNNTTSDKLNDTEYKKVAILGWAIELLQAYFLVADDMMDQSKTRRGQPCWYLVEGVNNIAINDSFMLEGAIYILLKNHFRQDPYYVDLLDLFHEVTFQTELGQLLDLITADEEIVDLNKFSLDKHSFIVIFKTAYYSFYLPVVLAMYMSGINNEKDLKQVKDILIPLGEYFQIQDDFLDCFGTPEQIGKIGTDIKDNKCSWVINQALLIVTPEQRQLLDNNYGKKNDECEQKCKDLFKQLGLEKIYHDYEESIVSKLRKQIDQIDESRGLKKDVLTAFLSKVYKRSK